MTWRLYDVTKGTNFPLFNDSQMTLTLHELDGANVSMVGNVTVDDYVYITAGATEIFRGYIKNIDEQDVTKIKKLTLLESGSVLKNTIVRSGTSRSFILTAQTINTIVTSYILNGSGWVSGTTDATVVPTIAFDNINSYDALTKLLYNMYGYEVWFVDNGTTKTVYWGTQRAVKGTVVYKKKIQTNDSNDRNLTDITVLGSDDSIYGTATTGTTPKKEKIYRNTTCKSVDECTKVAVNLLADYRNPRNRYTLTLAPNYSYNPCDKITVDGTDYVIKDITYTPTNASLGIGAYQLSFTDVYGGDIVEVTGSVVQGSDASWNGGSQNVSATQAVINKFVFNCKDSKMITGFNLKFAVDKWKSSTSNQTELLSDVSQVTSATNTTGLLTLGSNPYNYPSGSYYTISGMTNGYQFATVQCTFDLFGIGNVTRYVGFQLEYSYDTTTWYSCGGYTQFALLYDGATNHVVPITVTGLFQGDANNRNIYVRCRIYSPSGGGTVSIYSYGTMTVSRVTRHLHSITQQTGEPDATAPTTFQYSLNGSSWFNWTSSTGNIPVTITTGDNIFYVRSDVSGAGGRCSVTATASYQTIGKS